MRSIPKIVTGILFISLISGCASTKRKPVTKKPPWVTGELGKYEFRGLATGKRTREGAEHDAFSNGVRQIMESIGIRVASEYESKRREKGDLFEIEVKSRLKAKSRAVLSGVRLKETYWIEKEEIIQGIKKYFYDAWVLIEIPEEEYEKAKRGNEEYERSIVEEANRLLIESAKTEKDDPWRAYCNYKTILEFLDEVGKPEVGGIRVRVLSGLNRLKRFENPMVELMELKSSYELTEVCLVDVYGKRLFIPTSLDEGEKVKLSIKIKEPSYIYIINYDKTNNLLYLLFPNKYDRDNYLTGDGVYPKESFFEAEKPGGLNFIKVIASSEPLEVPDLNKEVITLGNDELRRILLSVRKNGRWDAKSIDFYIKL
ncbi:DUF4384 domain-containing protein [bacterium]|nr:DUF4384 domain-containing protein [bacterium]